MKTNYTIDGKYVRKNGEIEAICPVDNESKLHAIWVMEGRNPAYYYENVDGVVYRRDAHTELKEK
jgi:hypothetical protein